MRKAVFALFVFLVSSVAAQAGDDGLDRYYTTYLNGIRGYISTVLAKEFNADEAAMQAVLAGKPVVVVGVIESVREATYYDDPDNPDSVQGRAKAIKLEVRDNAGSFEGYLFDDAVPLEQLPVILQKGAMTHLLCEDVQRGPGGSGLQAKCRIIQSYPFNVNELDFPEYVNEELDTWLKSYPSGVRKYYSGHLVEDYYKSDIEYRAALKDKQVLVDGKIHGISEEIYYSNPVKSTGNQGKVAAIKFKEAKYYGPFVGYIFDEQVDTSILREDDAVELLCSEIQRGRGKVALQGKCKVIRAGEWYEALKDNWDYTNKELYDWLLTPAQGKAEAE